MLVLGAACLGSLGLALGTLAKTADQAQPLAQLTFLPISFISGVWFPLTDAPSWLVHLADFFPLSHLVDAFSACFVPGGSVRPRRSALAGDLGRGRHVRRGAAPEGDRRRRRLSGNSQLPLRWPEGAGPTMPGMEEHLFWIASRAAGIVALLLSSAAVGVGLTMGGRMVKGRGLDLRAAHEALSLATLIAIVVHAVALLGDSFLNLERRGTSRSRSCPATRSRGCRSAIVAGWGLVALGVSYYFRTRIGVGALEEAAPLDRARLARRHRRTRSARAPTPAPPGSSSARRSRSCPRSSSSSSATSRPPPSPPAHEPDSRSPAARAWRASAAPSPPRPSPSSSRCSRRSTSRWPLGRTRRWARRRRPRQVSTTSTSSSGTTSSDDVGVRRTHRASAMTTSQS